MTIPRVRSLLRALLLAAALGAVGLGAYTGFTRGLGGGGAVPPPHFEVVPVERGRLRETVGASGTFEARVRVAVASEVAGVVAAVFVDEGDRVARSERLVALERERPADRVEELRAALRARRAAAEVDLVGEAELELAAARRELERTARLREAGVVSQQRADRAQDRVRQAELALRNARAESDRRAADVDRASRALESAEKELARTVIRAPLDGVVLRRAVEVGSAVAGLGAGGRPVAELADDSRLKLVAEVDESDIGRVRIGQPVEVTVDAFPDERFLGEVRRVAPSGTVERHVSSFDVEVALPADDRIRMGMSADARIVIHEHADALLVPNRALVRDEAGTAVRRLAPRGERGFRLVPVETAYSDGFRTIVREGLREGDRILVRTGKDA